MKLSVVRDWLKAGKPLENLELRVTFYARVSTGKDEQLNSLSSQIATYTDLIQKTPKWIYVEGYIDEGKSGKSTKGRLQFLQMIEDAKAGMFDLILTKEISRFSRDTVDSLTITQNLLNYGVGVKFESDNILTFDGDSELRLAIMSSIAQEELRKISGRVKRGFKTAIELKHSVLGNNNIWGYNKRKVVMDGTSRAVLEINEEEAEIVRKIFDLYVTKGWGIRKIGQALNAQGLENFKRKNFTFSTVRGILSNPKYKGYYCGGKTSKENYKSDKIDYLPETEWVMFEDETGQIVPAIVDKVLWDKAKEILDTRREKMISENPTSYQNKYSYSGKIICGEHKTRYQHAFYTYKSGKKEVWQCKLYYEQGKKGCDSPILYTSELDEILKVAVEVLRINRQPIIDDLIEMYSHSEELPERKKQIRNINIEIRNVQDILNNLLDMCARKKLSEERYMERAQAYENDVSRYREQLQKLEEVEQQAAKIKNTLQGLRETIDKALDFEDGLPATIVDSLLDRIEVYKTDDPKTVKVKVYFKIIGEGAEEYQIVRKKGGVTSVCSIPST